MSKVFIISCVLISLLIGVALVIKNVQLEQNCIGYLKRAADASTISGASTELATALEFLEKHELTDGYTSVLWKTPEDDVKFWYTNLKNNHFELTSMDSTASDLEKSNMLMKLRETVLDEGKVTYPNGLSRYPNNLLWGICQWFIVCTLISIIVVTSKYE